MRGSMREIKAQVHNNTCTLIFKVIVNHNYFVASGDFSRLLIIVANSLNPDQDRQNKPFDTLIVFLKEVSKGAKIRNRYNQVSHLTKDTNGKVTH